MFNKKTAAILIISLIALPTYTGTSFKEKIIDAKNKAIDGLERWGSCLRYPTPTKPTIKIQPKKENNKAFIVGAALVYLACAGINTVNKLYLENRYLKV